MSLADFFRRHGNVFSISTKEVDAEPGDEDDVSCDEIAEGEPPPAPLPERLLR